MSFIADLHIHSHYSRATSKTLVPEHLDRWARIKGIQVVGTGDCTHPKWLEELRGKLEPADNGLYQLKPDLRIEAQVEARPVFFLPTGEISCIYKKGGKVRKVHHHILLPDWDACARLQQKLEQRGNIRSDGRPILGLDSRDLLSILLEASAQAILVPAHVWTPWFAILGSKSGFDTVEECFEDLSSYITAIETGLSSDPAMNWACSFLDRFQILSSSDAHSPEKLGREATVFSGDLSFTGIAKAIGTGDGLDGTIEFFPEEGKYHYDGHRLCGVCQDPFETLKRGELCPECGKPVTVGVMYRVAELADRGDLDKRPNRKSYRSITPLPELLSEILNSGPATKTVKKEYERLIAALGPEFEILLDVPEDTLRREGELLAEGIRRLRSGAVILKEGYDGEFGKIRVFTDAEVAAGAPAASSVQPCGSIRFDIEGFQRMKRANPDEARCLPGMP